MPLAQRNPSLETSKSSVELERGQVAGVAAETRQLQSRQTSARHFTFDQEEVRRQQGGGQLGQDSVSLVNERYQQQQTETIQNKEHQQDFYLDTNQQQNVVSHQQQQSSNSMYQHQSDGGQSSVQQSQHHQQQHTITQSSNNMTTTTTTKTVLTSEQWSSTNSTQHQNNKLATTTTEFNNNTTQLQDNKLATTTTAFNSSSQVQPSTAVGVGHEPMSYVASAKLKEQQVAVAGAGEVSVAYREFAAGVSGAAAAAGATVARAASNTSSSSSGAILASSVHPTVDLVKTSTPTHSRTSDSGSESSGHVSNASNVSNVSNEEIVRQHLKQFNQTAAATPTEGQHVVTARGRGRQYNTVTEQYVSSAVRGAEAATREAEDTVRPLEVDTGRVVPVVVDQEGYQRALAAKREAELQLVTEIAGQQQLVTGIAGEGQLVTEAAGAGQLVSHTELMQEHFHADSLQAAPGHSSPATTAQVAVSAARTAAEKNILAAEQFTAASAAGHTVGEAGDTSTDSLGSQGQVRKKYIITQQEIVFYIRNADGTVRIVNR